MKIKRIFSIIACAVISGCAQVPATVMPLGYVKPSSVPAGTDTIPSTDVDDPISIVLSSAYIADAMKSWYEVSAPNIAILVKVQTGDGSASDNKWLLVDVEDGVQTYSKLNHANKIPIWSGKAPTSGRIDIQIVKLNKEDKEKFASYLEAAKGIAALAGTALPAVAPAIATLANAGEQLNNSRENYTVILDSQAGAYPGSPIKYAAYVLMPQEVNDLDELWFDNSDRFLCLKTNDALVKKNWVAVTVSKGESKTFELSKADSLANIKAAADEWKGTTQPSESSAHLMNAVNILTSGAERQRIIDKTSPDKPDSIKWALTTMKSRRGDGVTLKVNDSDYADFLSYIGSFLPYDFAGKDIDSLITLVDTLNSKYQFEPIRRKWLAKTTIGA